ncbi:MAG: HAMP domain-containing histidine kinase [Acidobacteria bacterium]|nr:HAMP domain-containing histidine kinase [Acidobacteriota bacterium]MBI3424474.1 HAMP domain-containing histidine kinase [Acidobacteriota bacterium]
MRHLAAALKFGWTWWWGFGLLIAVPALALALLGLRAVRAERIEREQQIREQQTQIARLADAALAGALSELENATQRAVEPVTGNDVVFTFEPPGLLIFQRDRIWFGETDAAAKLRAADWLPATQRLIEQAQAAEAQGSLPAASSLYHRLSNVEPKLRGWAELCLARLEQQRGTVGTLALLNDPLWSRVDELSPTGLPLALLICPHVERLPKEERQRFAALLTQTLEHLRGGRWWLSYDERHFYDEELRRLLASVEAQPRVADARLSELAALERFIRVAPPNKYNTATRSFERNGQSAFLVLWTPPTGDAWRGLALAPARAAALSEPALAPLLAGQPFTAALRDAHGELLWGKLPHASPNAFTAPLRAVRGLELVFSGAAQRGWLQRRAWLWYGFILLLLLMLTVGLALTARVVRREVELGRLQNEFIAAVSHEFKSPITSIRLLMERLTSGRVHSVTATGEYHAAINRETDRLERLVNRLLETQQIQAGHRQYNFAPTALGAIIETAVEELHPHAAAKSIRLETRIAAGLPELPLDKLALTDALENLLDNAIKYSPTGTRVTVTAQAVDHTVHIEVCDEGIGIAPDDLPHIFDRFYRARQGDQHSVKGTGLGLALVKAAVEAHGGTVTVVSQPGEGSRFSLRIPTNEQKH